MNSPGSIILPDDVEVFEQAQRNLAQGGAEWSLFPNGEGEEEPHQEGGRWDGLRGNGMSELTQRNQVRAWRKWMQPA